MPNISDFPITRRWPAKHPDRLQLYSLPTPNGVKVSIMTPLALGCSSNLWLSSPNYALPERPVQPDGVSTA
jgi:hypothetical protein